MNFIIIEFLTTQPVFQNHKRYKNKKVEMGKLEKWGKKIKKKLQ